MKKTYKEIGRTLREAREKRGFSVNESAEQLRVRHKYIEAMEEGDFKSLPGEIYIEGHIKSYAIFLKLNAEEIIAEFRLANEQKPEKKEFITRENYSNAMRPSSGLAWLSFLAAVFIYIVWYQFQDFESIVAEAGEVQELQITKRIDGDDDSSIVLLAAEDVQVTVLMSSEIFSAFMMQAGDTYFVPSRDNLYLRLSKENAVDMFVDGEEIKDFSKLKGENNAIKLDIWQLLAHKRAH